MPHRRVRSLPPLVPLTRALRRHRLTPNQRWALVGTPALAVAGLLAATLHGLANALPTWWTGWCLIASAAGLLVAARPFVPLLRGDLERFDESRTWMFTVAGMYGSGIALAAALGRAAALHVDAPLASLSPEARTALTLVALATGGFCAAAVATGVATIAMFVRQWVDGRRLHMWDAQGRGLVGADAARAAADRVEWLASDAVPLSHRESMRMETAHLLQIASRAARGAILRTAFDGPRGELRESLRTAAACVQAGLADVELAAYQHGRMIPVVRQLRRLAEKLEGGYWTDAARVFGGETEAKARLERARARQLGYDLSALAMIAGLILMTSLGVFHTWFGTEAVLKARASFSTLLVLQSFATVRRRGWINREGYGTLGGAMRILLRMTGLPVPEKPDADRAIRPSDDARDPDARGPRGSDE